LFKGKINAVHEEKRLLQLLLSCYVLEQ